MILRPKRYWRWLRTTRHRTRTPSQHYLAHREIARALLTEHVARRNQHYGFTYKRIAIRNQSRRWGSCSSLGNLNFNYKLILLPEHLSDYIVVHELCHLGELNHGPDFWSLVADTLPTYKHLQDELRWIERTYGTSVTGLTKARAHYRVQTTMLEKQRSDAATNARLSRE